MSVAPTGGSDLGSGPPPGLSGFDLHDPSGNDGAAGAAAGGAAPAQGLLSDTRDASQRLIDRIGPTLGDQFVRPSGGEGGRVQLADAQNFQFSPAGRVGPMRAPPVRAPSAPVRPPVSPGPPRGPAFGPTFALMAGAAVMNYLQDRAERSQVEGAMQRYGLNPASGRDVLAARAFVWGQNMAPMAFADVPFSGEANTRVAEALMRNEQANPGMLGAAEAGDAEALGHIRGVVDGAMDAARRGVATPAPVPVQPGQGGSGVETRTQEERDLVSGMQGRGASASEIQNALADLRARNDAGPATRLPRTGGRWDGAPGESRWFSDNPAVRAVTGGQGVKFTNGRPDFSPWSKGTLTFKPGQLDGTRQDFQRVYEAVARAKGLPNAAAGRAYLQARGLTPHHASATEIQLIPTNLHANVPHAGAASDMRRGQ